MKKNFVTLFDKKCELTFGLYPNNTVAIQATYRGQLYYTCTVNWESNWTGLTKYKKTFGLPAVVIKSYSENEGMVDQLLAAGVVEKGGAYMAGTNGTVEVKKLTEKWIAIAEAQLLKKVS